MIARIEWTQEIFDAMPKTREEALRIGSIHFFPAQPCRNGHIAARAVKGYLCVLCRRDNVREQAERRRRRRGQKVMKPIEAPAPGSVFAELTATGQIERRLRTNSSENATHAFIGVRCSCGREFWLRYEVWGKQERCKVCDSKRKNFKHGLSKKIYMSLWHSAKKRARDAKIPFAIRITDICIPDRCPVLGMMLDQTQGASPSRAPRPNAPSLDRIDPAKGYTLDNVAVISHRANNLKKDGTIDEHERIAAFMETRGIEG